MKIAFSHVNSQYNVAQNSRTATKSATYSADNSICNIPSFCAQKPLTAEEKGYISELKALTPLLRDENGKFSLDLAVDLLKTKLDGQLMQYSESDIKNIVTRVQEANPSKSREDILKVMGKMSSFSNYDSLKIIENYLKDEHIERIYDTEDLTLNNIFEYLSKKDLCRKSKLTYLYPKKYGLFVDRKTIEYLQKMSQEKPCAFSELSTNIKNGNVKLIILDGFEAKTKDGYESFNFVGKWGNLEKATDSIIKAQDKQSSSVFESHLIKDLNKIFNADMPVNIIQNPIQELTEKEIAKRFNSKTVSKEKIKNVLTGLSAYAVGLSEKQNNTPEKQKAESLIKSAEYDFMQASLFFDRATKEEKEKIKKKFIDEGIDGKNVNAQKRAILEENLAKILYITMQAYSPRKIAKELKNLNEKIYLKAQQVGRSKDDILYLVPNCTKSYGLISYQNSMANDIPTGQFICNCSQDFSRNGGTICNINPDRTKDKVVVFMDDISGSAQSMLVDDVDYIDFKDDNPDVCFIFAPLAYSEQADRKINLFIREADTSSGDELIGIKKLKDVANYINVLPAEIKALLRYSMKEGFGENAVSIGFPHLIPDNCCDIASFLLEDTLNSSHANKAIISNQKRDTIKYILSH